MRVWVCEASLACRGGIRLFEMNRMPRLRLSSPLKLLGPGLVVAAAGIGAGDVVTATVTGAEHGTRLAWAVLACAALKLAMTEGLARWQLATGATVVGACARRLPRWLAAAFALYLLVWSFFVGASLTSACGLAGHSLYQGWPVWAWGVLHSLAAAGLVLAGRFILFEQVMKALVGVMVLSIVACAVLVGPHWRELALDLVWPRPAPGSGKAVLTVFGGIGGTMTLLCYGYWIREKRWSGEGYAGRVRLDVVVAYVVTFVFALALTVVAQGCNAVATQGNGMALEVAGRLEAVLGPGGRWAFLVGFWCAVFSAMLGVWQGVPYVFADFVAHWRHGAPPPGMDLKASPAYRVHLLLLAGPPLVLLFTSQPVAVVLLFTVVGAFFLPFLAGLLLYLNNQSSLMGRLKNGWFRNGALAAALLLFGWMALLELMKMFGA